MKQIKSILLRILGQALYLKLTSKFFFFYFSNGWLRSNRSYDTHYFIKNFVTTGDTVLDIGANLGYYTVQFAKLVGKLGKVYAVEPIELYRQVLTGNVGRFKQVQILPYALGETEAVIKMGNPSTDKHRHGLMRVLNNQEQQGETVLYEVTMKNPVSLFGHLEKIDYIKCDIEGYEVPVIPAMKGLIQKHQPIVQIETDGENKQIIYRLLTSLDYNLFYVQEGILIPYKNASLPLPADLIGIPADKTISYKHLFS
jgi:FkbM family methyltransferase